MKKLYKEEVCLQTMKNQYYLPFNFVFLNNLKILFLHFKVSPTRSAVISSMSVEDKKKKALVMKDREPSDLQAQGATSGV